MRLGIYAGSFNPFHKGHYNILCKAEKIFDRVIIARGINPDKGPSEYDLADIETIHDRYSNIEIVELSMFPYELKGLERLKEIDIMLFNNTG